MADVALTNTSTQPHTAFRLARHRRRLVLGSASVQECLLGQGHDVDLPPE